MGFEEIISSSNHMLAVGLGLVPFAPLMYG